MPKPSLLIVHMSLYNGGAERSLINFLRALPEDEYDISLLLFRTEGAFLPQLPKHVKLIETPEPIRTLYYNPNSRLKPLSGVHGLYVKGLKFLGNALAIPGARKMHNLRRQKRWRRLYRHVIPMFPGEYDVAMAYFHGEISYYVMDKVRAKRKVAWVHNDYEKTGQSPDIDRAYFQRFDAVASISPLCVDALKRAFPGLEEKFLCVPNLTNAGVVREMSREFAPQEFDMGTPRVLSVGRLNPQKACDISIQAAKILMARGVSFKWYWIGDGALRDTLIGEIHAAGVEDVFYLLGARENPYPYMASCDVFVQNSRYEGKSMVLDEVKILAKPIVVTNYPTVYDQIEPDVDGLIVDMRAEAVADGIERMLKDEVLRHGFEQTLAAREYDNTRSVAMYRVLLGG